MQKIKVGKYILFRRNNLALTKAKIISINNFRRDFLVEWEENQSVLYKMIHFDDPFKLYSNANNSAKFIGRTVIVILTFVVVSSVLLNAMDNCKRIVKNDYLLFETTRNVEGCTGLIEVNLNLNSFDFNLISLFLQ